MYISRVHALHEARRFRRGRFGRGVGAFTIVPGGLLLPMEALLGCLGGTSAAGGKGSTCWANRKAEEEVPRGKTRGGGAEGGFTASVVAGALSTALNRIAPKSGLSDDLVCSSRNAEEEVPRGRTRAAGAFAVLAEYAIAPHDARRLDPRLAGNCECRAGSCIATAASTADDFESPIAPQEARRERLGRGGVEADAAAGLTIGEADDSEPSTDHLLRGGRCGGAGGALSPHPDAKRAGS
eukprot:scaffold4743_cov171-Amphora_coffeaeformis.AAC.10